MMPTIHRLRNAALALAVVVAATLAGSAAASTIRQAQVSGHVTAIGGTSSISIDGHTYLIGAGTLAYQSIGSIRVGDIVSLVLDGAPNSSAAHVILIQPLPGGQASFRGQ